MFINMNLSDLLNFVSQFMEPNVTIERKNMLEEEYEVI